MKVESSSSSNHWTLLSCVYGQCTMHCMCECVDESFTQTIVLVENCGYVCLMMWVVVVVVCGRELFFLSFLFSL